MKFTPTTLWKVAANSPARLVRWKVYVRITTDLTLLLDDISIPWKDVSEYIREIPGMHSALEFQIGTFTSDSIGFIADNIVWWKTNIFTLTAGQYAELKIQLQLGIDDNSMAADTCYTFSGLIETFGPNGPEYTETKDEVKFSVIGYDENAQRIPGMSINYPPPTGENLYLDAIKAEIVDTNIASYPLSKGLHKLDYNYNSGTPTVSLDGGQPRQIIIGGNIVAIGNGVWPAPDTQRCTVLFRDFPIPTTATARFYVDALGGTAHALQDTIPTGTLLTRAYAAMGITSITLDNLTLASWDGTDRLSYLGRPPNDVTHETLPCKSIVAGAGTTIYIALGKSVYAYDTAAKTYTLLLTVATNIIRLFYNARNTHLWILESHDSGDSYAASYEVYNTATSAVTGAAVALRGACAAAACDLIDYNYTGTSYLYVLMVGDVTGYLDQYDTAGTRTQIGAAGAYTGYTWRGLFDGVAGYNIGDIMEWRGQAWICLANATTVYTPPVTGPSNAYWRVANSNQSGVVSVLASFDAANGILYYSLTRNTGGQVYMAYITVQATGLWNAVTPWSASFCDDPTKVSPGRIAVSYTEQRAYWWDSSLTNIYSQTVGDGTRNVVPYQGADAMPSIDGCSGMQNFGGIVTGSFQASAGWMLIQTNALGSSPHVDAIDLTSDLRLAGSGSALTSQGGITYGLDTAGRLFKLDSTIEMCHVGVDYSAMNIHDIIGKSLNAYLLLGKLSSMKKASVYKRIDGSGNLVTSGHSIAITVDNDEDITRKQEYLQACALISVTGQNGVTRTYNGTVFDAGQQPGDVVFSLSSEWIPAAIVPDIAYWLWKFVSTGHDLFPLAVLSGNAETDVFDGAAVTFTTTKIQKSTTGIIVDETIGADAGLTLKVLF